MRSKAPHDGVLAVTAEKDKQSVNVSFDLNTSLQKGRTFPLKRLLSLHVRKPTFQI